MKQKDAAADLLRPKPLPWHGGKRPLKTKGVLCTRVSPQVSGKETQVALSRRHSGFYNPQPQGGRKVVHCMKYKISSVKCKISVLTLVLAATFLFGPSIPLTLAHFAPSTDRELPYFNT